MFRWPTGSKWRLTALIFLAYAIISLTFALMSGLFEFKLIGDGRTLFRTGAMTFFVPALLEEVLFRGPLIALLPRMRPRKIAAFAVVSLVLFVAWHPLNASYILTQAQDLFFEWRFLVAAFFLGVATTVAAINTRSIWPSVAIHWAAVMLWKIFLGGPTFF